MNKILRNKFSTPFKYTLLIIWTVVNIFPLYWMLTFSLKGNNEIFGENVIGLPEKWMWVNYETAMSTGNMALYLFNSVIVSGCTILIVILFSLMASYALIKLKWPGQKLVYNIFMLGLTVPIHAAILPIYLILIFFGMKNSYQALIIPYAGFGLSIAIMICGSFMVNIPKEIEESACIDGCNVYSIFLKIILPLMKPAVASIGIFTFLTAWNELMFAIIFIDDVRYRTLSVGIKELSGAFTTDWGPIGAAITIGTIPTLIVYAFMSQRIQKSLISGAIKG